MTLLLRHSLELARQGFAEFLPDGEAERDARLLMCHALGISSAQFFARLDDTWPTGSPSKWFIEACDARKSRQPLSQIIGEADFYGRRFYVTTDVLTPRPDTETLIDQALTMRFDRILDLGTGPGTIALTLLAERPGTSALATDISQAALDVAARNADRLGLSAQMVLTLSNWFDQVTGEFDLIVSNPPYVDAATYAALQPEVRDWEPIIALTPGGDGLAAYRTLADQAARHLTPGGRLIVEIGHDQGESVTKLFQDGGFVDVTLHKDLAGNDRVVVAFNT